jgi:hypothetical protein
MSAVLMTTFEFIHGDLPGGRHEIHLPSTTSVTTIAGLYRDLTGADVSAAQLALNLRATHVTATTEASSAMDLLLGVANRRIEVSLLQSQRPVDPEAARGAAVQLPISGAKRRGRPSSASTQAPIPTVETNSSTKANQSNAETITIKIRSGDQTLLFRITKSTLLGQVMAAHASKNPPTKFGWRYFYDGDSFAPTATPKDLYMTDGDVVDAVQIQAGN